jgi:hypothetical protein
MSDVRISVLLLAAVGLLPLRVGVAQGLVVLAPKTHIRFVLLPDERAVVAEVLVQRRDSLWVRPIQATDTVAFTLSRLSHLDVSRGLKRETWRGVGIGLLSGALVGGALGTALGNRCLPADPNDSCASSRRMLAKIGAVSLGTTGAGVGALIGHAFRSDRWEPVPLTDRVKVAIWRGGQGHAYGMRFSYSIF